LSASTVRDSLPVTHSPEARHLAAAAPLARHALAAGRRLLGRPARRRPAGEPAPGRPAPPRTARAAARLGPAGGLGEGHPAAVAPAV